MVSDSLPSRFVLVWTESFIRTTKKFLLRHPDLKGIFDDVIRQLEINPHVPRLKLHPLKGKHRGKYAVSLTYEHRIILLIYITKKEIVLLDIGTHDEVYRG
jgi:mRNA-degrading endonuclease YafQ of YafQ-DinJ toxin-antitoxin module